MPAGRYLFIPFLRTKSQMRQTKNWSSEKLHKKDHRTNIIATNFVCEQLNTVWKHLKSHRIKASIFTRTLTNYKLLSIMETTK